MTQSGSPSQPGGSVSAVRSAAVVDCYQQVLEVLSRARRVLVTTHVRPDGDALGSAAAMVLAMQKKGIAAEVLLLSHLPRKYAFIFRDNGIPFWEVKEGTDFELIPGGRDGGEGERGRQGDTQTRRPGDNKTGGPGGGGAGADGAAGRDSDPSSLRGSVASSLDPSLPAPDFSLDSYDAFLVVDTGTWSQLPGLRERVSGFRGPKLVVDHHLTQEDWADVKLVVKEAAAAGEIVAELIEQWDVDFDPPIATALFLAIATDTGWFQFSSTRPYTLRLAAMLMEAGVDTDRMYRLVYQNERAERILLQTRAMQSLELMAGGRLAVMRISKADFEQTRAGVPDTENLVNVPLAIATVEASMILTEPRDFGPVRVSLRSKGGIDVARFAEQFGGGGHARASGLKIDADLATAHDRVVAAMLKELDRDVAG